MFGKGAYFADCVSKSANYCFASQHDYSTHGCLLLCEVALGNERELLQADYNASQLPPGAHSTKGVGRTQPQPSGAVVLADGVRVPCGPAVDVDVPGAALQYNEYIGAPRGDCESVFAYCAFVSLSVTHLLALCVVLSAPLSLQCTIRIK